MSRVSQVGRTALSHAIGYSRMYLYVNLVFTKKAFRMAKRLFTRTPSACVFNNDDEVAMALAEMDFIHLVRTKMKTLKQVSFFPVLSTLDSLMAFGV